GTYTIQDMVFTGGYKSGSGGAMMANTTKSITLRNVLFTGNTGTNGGGAIYMNRGTVNIYDSEFIGNTGTAGAALYQVTGTLNVYNSVFTGNSGTTASVYSARSGASVVNFVNSVLYGNNSGPVFAVADNNATVNATFIDSIIADNGDANDNQINLNKATSTVTLINTVVLKGADQTADSIASVGTLNLYYSVTDADYSATDNFSVTGGINNATFADTLEVVDGLPRVIATSAAGKNGVLVGKDSTGAFYIFGKNATGDAANWISLADSTVTAAFNVDAAGYGLGEGATVYQSNGMKHVLIESLKAKAEPTFFAGTYRDPDAINIVVNDATDTANTSLLTTTLREAIAAAVQLGGGAITFSKDVDWTEDNTIALTGSYMMTGNLFGSVTIDGSYTYMEGGETKTGSMIIDATGKNYRVFIAVDSDRAGSNFALTLKNFDIKGGTLSSNQGYGIRGGAIWGSALDMTLDNVNISGATNNLASSGTTLGAQAGGGAIGFATGSLTILNSTFDGNKTTNASGGVKTGGAVWIGNNTDVTIKNSTFKNNTLTANKTNQYGGGGAIYVYGDNGSVTIEESTFSNNHAQDNGGAIRVEGKRTVTITDTKFFDNTSELSGGAIYGKSASFVIQKSTSTDAENTIFSGNTAGSNGGAIYLHEGSTAITDYVFDENVAGANGGAIYSYAGVCTIVNNVFTYNKATGTNSAGGALCVGGANGNNSNETASNDGAWITNSTFYGNSAAYGGGIANINGPLNKPYFHNLTIAGNSATKAGGGLFVQFNASITQTLTNSIILGNTVGTDADDVCMVQDKANNGYHKFTISNSVIGVFRHGGFGTISNGFSYSAKHTQHVTLSGTVYLKELWGI
ncbi:MAG: hypothetical protein J6T08_10755, partial [Lentisphaeria bacterium]|nr:hypothetical protein [Lentisphaeria bacterium]